MNKRITALVIMDGFGIEKFSNKNAISPKTAPNVLKLMKQWPSTQIGASGLDVGLPDGQMGNSEVGHLNIGAGRIVYQSLTRISKSIEDGDFFKNKALNWSIDSAIKNKKKIHLMGLISPGGVHSSTEHLYALLKLLKKKKAKDVYIHVLLDGRDVPPTSGIGFVKELENKIKEIGVGKIATITGRYYTMDRDNIWERVEKGYTCMVDGTGTKEKDPIIGIQKSYDKKITDEFLLPVNIVDEKLKPIGLVEKEDSFIFFNFRPDRARQITRAFVDPEFNQFKRKKGLLDLKYVGFAEYDITLNKYMKIAYEQEFYKNTLGEYLSNLGVHQLRISETQKYAHVTFFFNGGVEKPNANEKRILIDSSKVATFDLEPEMKAYEVCDRAIKELKTGKYQLMILNFANCDMVGHTGVFKAAEKAVSVVDECVEKLKDEILKLGGQMLITADHGNCDIMIDENGEPFTAHTTNPVPLILVGKGYEKSKLKEGGRLSDLSPTLLDMMDIKQPAEMTGRSLIER